MLTENQKTWLRLINYTSKPYKVRCPQHKKWSTCEWYMYKDDNRKWYMTAFWEGPCCRWTFWSSLPPQYAKLVEQDILDDNRD